MRKLAALAGAGILLWLAAGAARAEPQSQPTAQDVKIKEVQVAAEAFSLGDPVPQWVEDATLPEAGAEQRTSLRLFDTQFLGGDAPALFARRALLVKDQPSLTAAGQIPIQFVPEYQHLQLHALRVLRGGETIDQTHSAQVRFLQRETGLERGMYSGVVTASILVNDLRVGDTLEVLYTIQGQNPVFGNKMVQTTFWDALYPTALRRAIVKVPADRKIYWRSYGDGARRQVRPVETLEAGQRKLVFEERNIAAAAVEPLTPPDYIALRWLQFSEFSSWDDVAAWGEQLFQVTDTANDEFRQVVDKLRAVPTRRRTRNRRAGIRTVGNPLFFGLDRSKLAPAGQHPSVLLRAVSAIARISRCCSSACSRNWTLRPTRCWSKWAAPRGWRKHCPAPPISITSLCSPSWTASGSISIQRVWGSMGAWSVWGKRTKARKAW